MRKRFVLCFAPFMVWAAATADAAGGSCVAPGQWLDPAAGAGLADEDLIAAMAKRPIVLLGEVHDNAEHHRWQLHTIAALHGRNRNMVLAFEAFPRGAQPALDRWIRGASDRRRFLADSRWNEVWRFDADLYMPLFHFARMHRIPMVGMNVEPALVARVGRQGWGAIPETERQGVTNPAPAAAAYVERLSTVFNAHKTRPPDTPVATDDPEFRRFVEAQQTWDRAMAQALAGVRQAGGRPLVVGIVGSGHIAYGHGIPRQLSDLGIAGAAVLLPWDESRSCDDLAPPGEAAVADAVFGIAAKSGKPRRPLLGVFIEDTDGGVRIRRVMKESVAEKAGLRKDDVVLSAAGVTTARMADLIAVVRRQAPGTWLPITARRGGETVHIVAKFPPER